MTASVGNGIIQPMIIKRDMYLDRLVRSKGDGFVKIVTGIRRCGKSFLLFRLFKSHLLKEGVPRENIVEIQLDKKKDAKLRNPDAMYRHLCDKTARRRGRIYVFIDEIHGELKVNRLVWRPLRDAYGNLHAGLPILHFPNLILDYHDDPEVA